MDAAFVAWAALAFLLLASHAAVLTVLSSVRIQPAPLWAAVLAQPVLSAVIWIGANGPIEGKVLLSFGASHGLTTADLVVLVPVAAAVAVVRRLWTCRLDTRQRSRPPRGRDL